MVGPGRVDDWPGLFSADHIASCRDSPKQGSGGPSLNPLFPRSSSLLPICLSKLTLQLVDVMPLESKYALRVSSISDDTTKEQYADFVRSVSAAGLEDCKRQSVFSSLKAKTWKRIGKGHLETPTESSRAASPSVSGQDDAPLIRDIDDGIRTSFATHHGLKVGTIAFSSKKTSELVLEGHERAKMDPGYPWKDWDLSNNFQGVTVLYEHEEAEEENDRGMEDGEGKGRRGADKRDEVHQRGKKSKVDME